MVTTIKGEKYLSLEECIEKLYNFTKGRVNLDKQHFVALIKTYKNQGINFKTLKHKMHLRLDVFETLMMGENRYDFINRAMNLYDKQIGYKEQVISEPNYNNDENDMKKYSDNLINKYQFENRKTIKLTESQVKKLVENFTDEGVTFSKIGDAVSMNINSKTSDIDNKNVDTRVFGTKNDILYGDSTLPKNQKSFSDYYLDNIKKIKFYKSLIDYVNNDFNGNLDFSSLRSDVQNRIKELIVKQDKQALLDFATTSLSRMNNMNQMDRNLYHRTDALKNHNDRTTRYRVGKVNGTNVNVIALFYFDDFNFSDAIKNGELRQNGLTDYLMNIDSKSRKRIASYGKIGQSPLQKIPVVYDGNKEPDILSNFSLNDVDGKSHFKKTYKGDGDYSSVNQFLDKSIIYAKYALTKEDFIPDYIVSAPSSSKFNFGYCTNLSRKLNVPYISDFFKRNLINVKFDAEVEKEMKMDGLSESERFSLETKIRSVALQEIGYLVSRPIEEFFVKYNEILSNISLKKMSREKCDISLIKDILAKLIMNSLTMNSVYEKNSNVYKMMVTYIYHNMGDLKSSKYYDINHITKEITNRITTKIGKGVFANLLSQIDKLILFYDEQFKSGYNIDLRSRRFKITQFDKRFRKYLKNVYIISDDYLNKDKELFTRFKNSKFLIVDEDINSGATLKLVIDSLKMKINNSDKNILCLVNAYSETGK